MKKSLNIKKKKIVYVAMAADILHEGHINILKNAKKYGRVIVGLLTDHAIVSYKRLPHLNFKQRKIVLKNIKFVDEVISQHELDYRPNLNKIKPDYVIHGDDWKKGPQKNVRLDVIHTLKKWGGKLIEPNYTKNISSTIIKSKLFKTGASPEIRRQKLKRFLEVKKIVKIIESHSPLTGILIEKLSVDTNKKYINEFDGIWSSSLTDSTLRGKPDNQSVDYSTRLQSLKEIMEVTTKPIIFDGDNGGLIEHLPYLIRPLDQMGVSAIILEDKIGLKKNSLFEKQDNAKQDSIKNFCKKIQVAKRSQISDDFMIIARVESFILGKGLSDAIKRTKEYVKSGADAIMIHSKINSPKEIFMFSKKIKKEFPNLILVAVPSTYSSVSEKQLIKNGFSIVIYANQLLRASIPAMKSVAVNILKKQRSYGIENKIISIKEILNLIES